MIDSTERLDKMMEVLKKKEITPEMLTKEMLDVFVYRIIVIDDRNLVFVINTTNSMTLLELRDKRHDIVEKPAIYSNSIRGYDPIKLVTLKYKVVAV